MSIDPEKPESHPKTSSDPAPIPDTDDIETDLWDLEADEYQEPKELPPRTESGFIPAPRTKKSPIESRKPVARQIEVPIVPVDRENTASEDYIDMDPEDVGGFSYAEAPIPTEAESLPEPPAESENVEEENDTAESEEAPPPALIVGKNYFASLSIIEKIGIFTLFATLFCAAVLAVIHFSNNLEIKPLIAEGIDLPVNGKLATISSVETYWREPVREGENADVVRLEVKLVPIIRIGIGSTSGTQGAIRVLFRDGDRTFIGDSINLPIPSKQTLEINATDGFTEMGMHAGYQTGDDPRWTVEILEGPSISAPIEEFTTLLETEISTPIR